MLSRLTLLLLALLTSVAICPAFAQAVPVRATRPDGSTVLLFPDGTWRTDSSSVGARAAGAIASFSTPSSATATLDLGRGVKLHYNPAKWQLAPAPAPGRQQLRHVDGDAYAMTISERLQVPAATLHNIVVTNAKNFAQNLVIGMTEQRRVNGVQIEALQFTGEAQEIPFHWYGYYYSGTQGAFQIVTFCGASLYDSYKADFEDLLNGLQVDQP